MKWTFLVIFVRAAFAVPHDRLVGPSWFREQIETRP
jgi:hypothetical protein